MTVKTSDNRNSSSSSSSSSISASEEFLASGPPIPPPPSTSTVKRRTIRRRVASCVCVTLAYAIVLLLVVLFAVRARGLVRKSVEHLRLYDDRICVSLHRHAVQPITPAIDSELGGEFEPFSFGWLLFDERAESVEWRLDDSLGVDAHSLSIHGPLTDSAPHTAPLYVQLGAQRNAQLNLAGVAFVAAHKIHAIRAHPSRFYIAAFEKQIDHTVRELARSDLATRCVRGIE